MYEYLSVIRNSPLFTGVGEAELESMLGCLSARTEDFGKNESILRPGDNIDSVGLMLTGGALVVQDDFWGNRNILTRVVPGQVFAEAFACSPGAILTVEVIAEAPSKVLFLSVGRILTTCPTACAHHSRMIRNLLSDVASKELLLNEKLSHMSQRSTREKLLSYLSAEARSNGSPDFTIPFDRQQLADYLSVERSAMSSTLSKLRDEGLLKFDKNHFTLYLN